MKIQDLMTTDVKTCQVDDTLNRAAQLMWEHDIGCAPVVDAEGKLCGMLTDRDICMSAYTQGGGLSARRVRDAMSPAPQTCSPSSDVAEAAEQMTTIQVRRVPVVEGTRLVGIVALNDIALAASSGGRQGEGITQQEVGKILAAICRHRVPEAAPRTAA